MIETIENYKCIFENIKNDIRNTRYRIIENANCELINLYFRLGKIIDDNWKYGNNFVISFFECFNYLFQFYR